MADADGRHFDDIAVEQLDAVVAAKDADVRETVVFVRREQPSLLCRSHVVPPAGLADLTGDRSMPVAHGHLIARGHTHGSFLLTATTLNAEIAEIAEIF